MKNKNGGFSLVEIIVIIAIISIVSVGGIVGVGSISGKNAEQAANKLKTTLISDRTTSLGKYKTMLHLDTDGSGIVLQEAYYSTAGAADSTKSIKICGDDVTVTKSTDGTTFEAIPTGGFDLEFDRSSGALKSSASDVYIRFEKAHKTYTVLIYHLTGKVVVQ